MKAAQKMRVARRVQATKFRSQYRRVAAGAQGGNVVLIENRRQEPKYLVDKKFLDALVRENANVRATLEVLSDPVLTQRLLDLGKTIDSDIRSGRLRLYTTEEVFGK